MLKPEDREAIEGLFERIDTVARAADPRDAEAEDLIAAKLRRAPEAAYYMAQTILVQEHALRVAEQRIAELEAQAERAESSGFLGGLFGGNANQQRGRRPGGPWSRRAETDYAERGNGGFLAGAAQTALGVTGGVLLGSAIAGMLSGEAEAQEYQPDDQADQPDEGGYDDLGGDGGDFDVGGDF